MEYNGPCMIFSLSCDRYSDGKYGRWGNESHSPLSFLGKCMRKMSIVYAVFAVFARSQAIASALEKGRTSWPQLTPPLLFSPTKKECIFMQQRRRGMSALPLPRMMKRRSSEYEKSHWRFVYQPRWGCGVAR